MVIWQQSIIFLYCILSLIFFIKGYQEVASKKNAFGQTNFGGLLGIFVWGDSIILSPFWILVCIFTIFLNSWHLFLLSLSVFWVVRSLGEIQYWLNEQFAEKHRNPPSTLKLYKLFQNDSVWFIYQLFWQCILVVSLIASVFITTLWLNIL